MAAAVIHAPPSLASAGQVGRKGSVRCAASPPVTPLVNRSFRAARLLPLMAESLENQAKMTKFERTAGRTSMVAVGVAAALELVTYLDGARDSVGLFGSVSSTQLAAAALAIALSALLATTSKTRPRTAQLLLEPLLASLTSASRSQGSVTQGNVDCALDALLDSVFCYEFLRRTFPLEEDK